MGERNGNGRPPGLDGCREPSGLRHRGVDGGVVEVGQPPPDLGRLTLFQQQPEAFFHAPGGADLLSWIMLVEHPAESGPLLGGQVIGAGAGVGG
ncbi:MAG TPA: hypothetical protein VKA58_06690 [Propionibacteriaceae bacterium]|nr:hypothetical protein [Propionibacteriaceae bacterium]